jgi:hypothetical protein
MLPNEVFALACRAYYEEQGLIVNEKNGQFAHSPLTRRECDTGYYLLWGHHQHQGLLQSKDLDKCCFFTADSLRWLKECDYFPENFFELWDIYDKYSSELGKTAAQKTVELRVGVHGRSPEKMSEDGKKASNKLHEVKNDEGKSAHAVKMGKSGGRESVCNQSGVHNPNYLQSAEAKENSSAAGKRTVELQKGVHNPEYTRSDSRIEDSKRGGNKNVENQTGFCSLEYRDSERYVEHRKENATKTNSQIWESLKDGYRSNAGAVASHNRSKGWDPNARVRIL